MILVCANLCIILKQLYLGYKLESNLYALWAIGGVFSSLFNVWAGGGGVYRLSGEMPGRLNDDNKIYINNYKNDMLNIYLFLSPIAYLLITIYLFGSNEVSL